jgi:hypothetical protein
MRTRAHNVGIKKWRLVNERKRAKEARQPTPSPPGSAPSTLAAGDRFDRLTAIERADDYVPRQGGREERWVFECMCGARVTWKASTVVSNVRRLGWCSCPVCYRDAGGWEAIARGMEGRS